MTSFNLNPSDPPVLHAVYVRNLTWHLHRLLRVLLPRVQRVDDPSRKGNLCREPGRGILSLSPRAPQGVRGVQSVLVFELPPLSCC
jgi:hypothetical protein